MSTEVIVPEKSKAMTQTKMLRPIANPKELIEVQDEITKLITEALTEGVDYGTIPGTQTPTLYKPGAERLLRAFGCNAVYELVQSEVDHDRIVKWTKKKWNKYKNTQEFINGESLGLYRYLYKCKIFTSEGREVGNGDGTCSTLESKYIDRPRDCENTALKMAQKRAFIAATLNAYGLSNRFTQDMEDITENKKAAGDGHDENHSSNHKSQTSSFDGSIGDFECPVALKGIARGQKLKDTPQDALETSLKWWEGKETKGQLKLYLDKARAYLSAVKTPVGDAPPDYLSEPPPMDDHPF